MSAERLELVTEFSSLKAGMLVVVNCRRGCGNHRYMLVKLTDNDWVYAGVTMGWWTLPKPNCSGNETYGGVTTAAVTERRVYRVVDPDADKAETTEAETPRKLVKT